MGRYIGYNIEKTASSLVFEFISKGAKGEIKKRVFYEKIGTNTFNLAFGDVNPETDDFDDTVTTNNGDTQEILATVAKTALIFLEDTPNAYIYVEGSSLARTRLYRIGISNNLEMISEDFYIYATLGENEWEFYKVNQNYKAFLITKK
jgi:hypothetical protein